MPCPYLSGAGGFVSYFIYIIAAYIIVLTIFNILRSRKVKSQDDFMVAGRTLPMTVIVFTLICTWIGSGTFIAGAEYAYMAGWSSLWMPAGAWLGIVAIYFLAGKIRTFGKYTVGDILEVRYGKFARLFGSAAIIISFTAIVSYQLRAGGLILNVITQDEARISYLTMKDGRKLTVRDLKILTEGEKEVIEYTDTETNTPSKVDSSEIAHKEFKAMISVEMGQIISAAVVILFTAIAGMVAVAYTDLPNGIIILLACILAVPFVVLSAGGWSEAVKILPAGHFQVVHPSFGKYPWAKAISYFLSTMILLMGIQSMYQKFYSARSPKDAKQATVIWIVGTIVVEVVVIVIAVFGASYFWNKGYDPASIVLLAARYMVPQPVGILLFAAACVVVLSTGMNYLLSPTTNIMRDIYQRFINPEASQKTMVRLQKIFVILLGIAAYLLATQLTSVLEMSYFAYVMYGVAVTPALIAALAWKRATKAAGLSSIIGGTVVCILLKAFTYILPEKYIIDGDAFGIPLIYPSLAVSLIALVAVSYLTPPPKEEELKELFG
jgi:SSS family solute:Na+ symporter/sodium/proline symporter